MNARLRITIGAVVIAVLAALATWRLARQTTALRADAAKTAREISDLRTRRSKLSERRSSAEAKPGQIETTAPAATKAAPAHRSKPSWLELMRTDPKVQNLYLDYQHTEVLTDYAELTHQLHLDGDRWRKFVDLVARKRAAQLDLQSAFLSKGLTEDDPSAQKLLRDEAERYEAAQRDLLGEQGLAQLKTYEHELFARDMVHGIIGDAVLAGLSFSRDQVSQLVKAIMGAGTDGGTDWQKFDERAAQVLTPAQLQFLQTHEAMGPNGAGWRFQGRLNDLITKGDETDRAAGIPVAAAPSE